MGRLIRPGNIARDGAGDDDFGMGLIRHGAMPLSA
jgi:hypothetical protein